MQRNIFVIYNHWKKKKQFPTCMLTVTLSNVLCTKSLHSSLSVVSTVDSTKTRSRGGPLEFAIATLFFFHSCYFFHPSKGRFTIPIWILNISTTLHVFSTLLPNTSLQSWWQDIVFHLLIHSLYRKYLKFSVRISH